MNFISNNLLRYIFDKINRNVVSLLRLVCKKWSFLIKTKRCSAMKMMTYCSFELLLYLDEYQLINYSNYKYMKFLMMGKHDNDKYIKMNYLILNGIKLTERCFINAIYNEDLKAIDILIENNCPMPKNVTIKKYSQKLIEKLYEMNINITLSDNFIGHIPHTYLGLMMIKNGTHKFIHCDLVFRMGYFDLLRMVDIKKCTTRQKRYLLKLATRHNNINIIHYLKVEHNVHFGKPLIDNENIIKNFPELSRFTQESTFWSHIINKKSSELLQFLWDNNLKIPEISLSIYAKKFKKFGNIKNINNFYKFLNWCLSHGVIFDTYVTSCLALYDDIDLLIWCKNMNLPFDYKLYTQIINNGSCSTLNWLYENHKIDLDFLGDYIMKNGTKKMICWFIEKSRVEFSNTLTIN